MIEGSHLVHRVAHEIASRSVVAHVQLAQPSLVFIIYITILLTRELVSSSVIRKSMCIGISYTIGYM